VDKLAALLAHRDPVDQASEVLSVLLTEFGAMAGSLLYATRPPLHVRQGTLSVALVAHLDRWESTIENRIAAGPWRIASHAGPPPAWQPLKGTGQTAVFSLIHDEGRVAGAICLVFPTDRLPTGPERASLANCLQVAGNMVGLVGELALTKKRMSQLSLFYQVAQVMASTYELDKVVGDTLELAMAMLDASAAALLMIDEEKQELLHAFTHGDRGDFMRGRRTKLGQGLPGWVASHGKPLIANDAHNDPRSSVTVDTWIGIPNRSVVCVPVQNRGKTIGVLQVLNKRSQAGFDAEDLSLMIMAANQAAIAIENNQLYQNLRDEQDRIIQAQENVRRQVARNLHDGTVQFLSAISMGIDHLERLLGIKPEAAKSELEALRDLTRQATKQARMALFELRPLILETQGLVPALEAYVQQLQDNEAFDAHLQAAEDLPDLGSSVSATVFSIVQEAVTNAKKHAAPRDVWLRLSQENGGLRVVVEDNGTGFDPGAVEEGYDRRGSIGLLNMRERADLIEGQVEIQSSTSSPGAGTRVILNVPRRSPDDQSAA
jgi:signal transduction histidine kinase